MRQRLGRWWRWVIATRARRSALTLAVLAALAAPFATRSYTAQPHSFRAVPLTAEDRAQIIAQWGEDTDVQGCEQAAKQRHPQSTRPIIIIIAQVDCEHDRKALKQGSRHEQYLSLSNYVALNGAVMLATLIG